MQKIKITSNSPIIKPQSLENIDVSFGVSYFSSQDQDVKVIENDWGFKLLSKISRVTQTFTSKIFNNKEIIDQILDDSKFVLQHQGDNAENLHIQINQNNITANILNSLTAFNILRRINFLDKESKNKNLDNFQDLLLSLDSKAGHIYSKSKKMFLGTSFFEKSNSFYKSLSENFTKKEAVSFVFFHEYSHSSELMNNEKYGKEENTTNTSLDNFYSNLLLLSTDKRYIKFAQNLQSQNKSDFVPNNKLIKTLCTLHKEIYADVGALLLMRNKELINGTFNESKFQESIAHIIKVRKQEKQETSQVFNDVNLDSYLYHDHFTAPGIESLLNHLNKKIGLEKHKVLSEKEIHQITGKCVQEGVGKTVLSMIKADNTTIPQLNTLFALRVNKGELEIDNSKNHYLDAVNKIKEVVSKDWQKNFETNMNKINALGKREEIKIPQDLIFDAGLDNELFEKKLIDNKLSINKIKALEGNEITQSKHELINEDKVLEISSFSKTKENITSLRASFLKVVSKNKLNIKN